MSDNISFHAIYQYDDSVKISNHLSDPKSTDYLNQLGIFKNNKINFVGLLNVEGRSYFSFPFIFKDVVDLDLIKTSNKIMQSIVRGYRIDANSFRGRVDNKKEYIRNEFVKYYHKNKYPKYVTNVYKSRSGKLDKKKTCNIKNMIVVDGKLNYKKIYFKTKHNYHHRVIDLIDGFLSFECKECVNAQTQFQGYFKDRRNLKELRQLLMISNEYKHKKYILWMIDYIESYSEIVSNSCYCINYENIWEMIVHSYLNVHCPDKYALDKQKYFVATSTFSNKKRQIVLDHFMENERDCVIIDSKYKKINDVSTLDYKQLFYNFFMTTNEENKKMYYSMLSVFQC